MENKKYYCYFLTKNTASSDKTKNLSIGYKVLGFLINDKNAINHIRLAETTIAGPFNSIKKLRQSIYFDNIKQKYGAKKSNKLLEEKFIHHIVGHIYTPINKDDYNSYKILAHGILGNFEKNQIGGIHLIPSNNSNFEIIKITKNIDCNGVFEAEFSLYSPTKNKTFIKKSTFFPQSWDETQFAFETYYAIQNMKKKEGSYFVYESKTISEIPVKIIKKNNEIKSIYPIYL